MGKNGKCSKCGKMIKGRSYTLEEKKFCCEQCRGSGRGKKSNVCEFC